MLPTDGAERIKRRDTVTLDDYKAICPRCGGRGLVVCPGCGGTGEIRNSSWTVVGPCDQCEHLFFKGFLLCPKCNGLGRLRGKEETR